MESTKPKVKWYLRPVAVIIALLGIGPLALPLVWISPAFKKSHKIVITIVAIGLSIWLFKASVDLYNLLLKRLEELQEVMSS